jgi:hypothetical protein
MYLLEETRHKEKFLDFFLFSILLFSGLIEGVIVMSIVSYLSVQGMLVFLDCKHALLSRKKLHSDHEGIIIISLGHNHLLKIRLLEKSAQHNFIIARHRSSNNIFSCQLLESS